MQQPGKFQKRTPPPHKYAAPLCACSWLAGYGRDRCRRPNPSNSHPHSSHTPASVPRERCTHHRPVTESDFTQFHPDFFAGFQILPVTPDHSCSTLSTRQASEPHPTIKSLESSNLTPKEQLTTCLAFLPFHSLTSIILPSNFEDQMLRLLQEVHLDVENN